VVDICRKLAITETTFYRWKRRFAGLDVSEVRELKQLRDENRKLKQVVADLTLDKQILREALGKNGRPRSSPGRCGLGAGGVSGEWAAGVSGAPGVAPAGLVSLGAAR
jgi:putative transposase